MQGSKRRKNPRCCRRCGHLVHAPEEIKPGGTVCLACQRRRSRKRAKKWYGQHRQRVIERSVQWKREHPEKVREHRDAYMQRVLADPEWALRYFEGRREAWRDWYERMSRDPEKVEHRLALQRESHRAKRIERGLPVRQISEQRYRELYGSGYGRSARVPIEPLLPFLRIVQADDSVERLAANAGVSTDLILDVLHAERNPISLVTADRICAALDLPLGLLYQDDAA